MGRDGAAGSTGMPIAVNKHKRLERDPETLMPGFRAPEFCCCEPPDVRSFVRNPPAPWLPVSRVCFFSPSLRKAS